jgi:hypothetical protein
MPNLENLFPVLWIRNRKDPTLFAGSGTGLNLINNRQKISNLIIMTLINIHLHFLWKVGFKYTFKIVNIVKDWMFRVGSEFFSSQAGSIQTFWDRFLVISKCAGSKVPVPRCSVADPDPVFFTPWIRENFFQDPGSRIRPLFLVKFSYIYLRILVIFLWKWAYSWNHKQQDKTMFSFATPFLRNTYS